MCSIASVSKRLILPLLAFCAVSLSGTDIVQTVSGGGSLEGYKPNEANLDLGNSLGLAISPLGDIYVSNTGDNQVLKINSTTGAIQVYAGNGTRSFSGDGGPATGAGLNRPGALALDASGNLFIADRGNFVIRRVDALTGIITTVAGNGRFTGETVDAVATPLGEGGLATAASFGSSTQNVNNRGVSLGGLRVDSTGAVIVADQFNHIIRKFTVGGNITTIAGDPTNLTNGNQPNSATAVAAAAARFNQPTGLVFDAAGNLYIADGNSFRIKRLDTAGQVALIAGSGNGNAGGFDGDGEAAINAAIGNPSGMAIDSTGRLIITCVNPDCLRAIDIASATPIIVTIAGRGNSVIGDGGPATGATLNEPRDVAIDPAGNLFVYDVSNLRIRRIDKATGFISTAIGTGLNGFIGDRGPNQFAVLKSPLGAALDAAGNLYIADTNAHAIRKVAPDGTITTIAGVGSADFTGDGGAANLASLNAPSDVIEVGGSLYIADTGNSRVRRVDLSTGLISTFCDLGSAPQCLTSDPAGFLLVSTGNQVRRIASDGVDAGFVASNPTPGAPNAGDGLPAANATLNAPRGIAVGANGELYIAENGAHRVRVISAAGVTSTFAGTGAAGFAGDGGPATAAQLNAPYGIAVTSNGTAVVIGDGSNHRIRSVATATNVISTICGTGTAGFSGDGDVAVSAQVNSPAEIFLNGTDLFFVDTNNNRVRKISSAIDIDSKLISFSAKLTFTVDKKTGQLALNKDSVSLKAALPLPAGITAANLIAKVDIVDLHQQVKFDEKGKQPKATKAAKAAKVKPVFDFTLPAGAIQPASKFALSLKGTSVAGAKPTSFSFASKGTLRNQLARAGFSNETVTKQVPVRINITLGTTTFTGLTTCDYKATQGKSGAAKSVKVK